MKKLYFTIDINAPKEKVWETMLNKDTYEIWTKAFNEGAGASDSGSTYEGEWKEGAEMKFLGKEDDGTVSGMIARVKSIKPHEFVSVESYKQVLHGVESEIKDDLGNPAAMLENYTFTEKNGGTEVAVDIETIDEYADIFNGMWPKALAKLKEISEG